MVIELNVGDTGPPAQAYLLSSDGATPFDGTGASIRFVARRNGVVTINGAATLYPGSLPTEGHFIYYWASADTAVGQVGWHECSWVATDVNGKVYSFPTQWEDPLRLHIRR